MSLQGFRSPELRKNVLVSYQRNLARWTVEYQERKVHTHYGDTHCIEAGTQSKPPLLILHSGYANSSALGESIAELAGDFHLFAIDIPGEMGKSRDRQFDFFSEDYSSWLQQVIHGLSFNKVNLLGIGLGAALAARFSIKKPSVVDQLLLVTPPLELPSRPGVLFTLLLSAMFPTRFMIKRMCKRMRSKQAAPVDDWLLEDIHLRLNSTMHNANELPALSDTELEALPEASVIVFGEDDPRIDKCRLKDKISGSANSLSLQWVANAGHTPMMEQAALSGRLIADVIHRREANKSLKTGT